MQSRNASWLGRSVGTFMVLVALLGMLATAALVQQHRTSAERQRSRAAAAVALARPALGATSRRADGTSVADALDQTARLAGGRAWLLDSRGVPLGADRGGTSPLPAALTQRVLHDRQGQVSGDFGLLTFADVPAGTAHGAVGSPLHLVVLVPPQPWPAGIAPWLWWLLGVAVLVLGVLSVVIGRQQTLLRIARREAESSSRLLADIFQHSVLMMVIEDRDGRIQRINDAGARMIGRRREELEGARIDGLASDETVARLREHDAEVLAGHRVTQHEEHVDYVGGSYTLLTTRFPVTDMRGQVIGVGAVSADITARMLSEQALRLAKAEAESASRAKSAFLASMSHELRTPLNSIIGLSSLLMEDLQDAGQEGHTEPLRRVIQAGRHLLELINEILEFSRLEAGRTRLDLHPVEVRELVEEVEGTLRPLALANGNRLTVTFEPAVAAVYADPTRLRQVLVNLIGNATKFTRDGEIGIYVGLVPHPGGRDQVTFVVSDSGIGMDEAQLEHIFEPFQQSEPSISRRFGGTGLGLSISRQLVHLMGGEIEVESAPGQGSAFTVRLPAAPAATAAGGRNGHCVLVADDDPDARHLLCRALQPLGVQTVTAASGAEALQRARECHPDLLLLDIMLGDMSGWEVLQQLRGDATLRELPVIVCTVSDRDRRMMPLGVIEHLTKPIDARRLRRLVQRCMLAQERGAVLVADPDPAFRGELAAALREQDLRVVEAGSGADALERLREGGCALLMTDPVAGHGAGLDLVGQVRADPDLADTAVILLAGRPLSAERVVELGRRAQAMLAGNGDGHRAMLAHVHGILRHMDAAEALKEGS